jgi:hypothetical protein
MKLVVAVFIAVLGLPLVGLAGATGSSIGKVAGPDGDLSAQVLVHPSIALSSAAASDVRGGIAHARALSVLLILAEEHTLSAGPIRTGHSYYVKGTSRVSDHVFGRAVDVTRIDGRSVSPTNLGALRAVQTVLSLPEPLRPDEVGSPWRFPERGSFTDREHRDHIHVGWS